MALVSDFCRRGACDRCEVMGCGCREAPHGLYHEHDDAGESVAPAGLVQAKRIAARHRGAARSRARRQPAPE